MKIIRKIIYIIYRILNIFRTYLAFKVNNVSYSSYRCYGVPFIHTETGSIKLGSDFAMNNGMFGNQIGFNNPCILRVENGNITIGDNVGISQSTLIAKGANIIIGNNVKLGGGVKIYTTDFHSLNFELRRNWEIEKHHCQCKSVIIEDDCFIGAGSIILKGITVGARSIVGAGSVVTKSIPSGEIWGGNPAKFIKKI